MSTAAARSGHAAVVGGGFAGLSAAAELAAAGLTVTLVEQGRGLGGRVCSRRADVNGAPLYFDHGAQYLTAKAPAFASLLASLAASGHVARWGADGSIGDVPVAADGALDLGAFKPYDPAAKQLWVGLPTMSAVGRQLAAAAGESLHVVRGTRVAALQRGGGGKWRLQLEGRAPAEGETELAAARQRAQSSDFDFVVTAMSANSTRRLLAGVCDAAAADAAAIRANVCWALMVALAKPTGLPFNGALVTNAPGAPECPIAWLARDSSKPGRALPPGVAETWVVHAAPGWSNARAESAKGEAAAQLLAEFLRAARLEGEIDAQRDVLYLEAHAWSNAYPLNPRAPVPVEGCDGAAGAFVLDRQQRIVACGDWCLGPRASDAWASGREAAQAALRLLA